MLTYSLERNLSVVSLCCPVPETRIITIKRMLNLSQTHKSQKWIPVLPPLFLQYNDCKIELFLCLRFLGCKMEKYINNNNNIKIIMVM